jgi:Cu-Zn family superoxide dismutase
MGVEETDMNAIRLAVVPFIAAGLVAAGCTSAPREGTSASASPGASATPAAPAIQPSAPAAAAGGAGARAELNPTQGNQASGQVTFTPAEGGLRVTAHLTGLTPGERGFHLHETPDCSAADGSSAGNHWNPTLQPHGSPDAPAHHAGDLGNVTADASGAAHLDRVVKGLALEGNEGVIGRAVIVHGQRDDLTSQPSGNAGPRLACGVVEPAPRRDPGD